MMKIILPDGAKLFRQHQRKIREALGHSLYEKKRVYRKNKHGEITWEKFYYYEKIDRDVAVELGYTDKTREMLEEKHDPTSTYVRYFEKMLPDKPQGFEEDLFSQLIENKLVSLEKKALITDTETLEILIAEEPEFSRYDYYVLK